MFRYAFILFVLCVTAQAKSENKKRSASPHIPIRHSYSEYQNNVAIPIPQPVPVSVPRPVPVSVPVAVPVDSPRPVPVSVPQPVAQVIARPVAVPVDRPVAVPVSQPVPVTITQGVGIPVPQPYAVSVPAPVPVGVPQPVAVPVVAQAVGIGLAGSGIGIGGISGVGLGGLSSGISIGGLSSGIGVSGISSGVALGGYSSSIAHGIGSRILAPVSISHPIITSGSGYASGYGGGYSSSDLPNSASLSPFQLYSIFGLASCLAALNVLPSHWSLQDTDVIFSYAVIVIVAIVHAIALFLSTLMMIGVLKEKANLIKPWVILTSLQVFVDVLIFVFWTTLSMIHHYGDGDLLMFVLEFMGLMIRFYMLMIVSSYYKKLDEATSEEVQKLRNITNHESWYNAA
ncbi:putative cuticle protein CPG39 [Danaus plexippus plexippus]|uniref:Cuticle protein CPG39 n=1 Tax=Danaus plexippus plexippus TaxID=278856 RepID=A0A212EVN3_DANPL|nr:putative cuticle protein CPG39 [Danaus plexippus plexippus]